MAEFATSAEGYSVSTPTMPTPTLSAPGNVVPSTTIGPEAYTPAP